MHTRAAASSMSSSSSTTCFICIYSSSLSARVLSLDYHGTLVRICHALVWNSVPWEQDPFLFRWCRFYGSAMRGDFDGCRISRRVSADRRVALLKYGSKFQESYLLMCLWHYNVCRVVLSRDLLSGCNECHYRRSRSVVADLMRYSSGNGRSSTAFEMYCV